MADAWYYTSQGQQLGPVSAEELRRYAAAGRLDAADLVWKDGMPRWVPVQGVPDFAPTLSSAPEATPRHGQDASRHRQEPAYDEDDRQPRRRQRPAPAGMSTGAKVAIGLGIGGGVLFVIVVVLVVLVIATTRPTPYTPAPGQQFGGATAGPKTWRLNFGPQQRQSWQIEYRSGGPARFWINGLDRTDVEIRVYDTTTNLMVASSTGGITDRRDVTWHTPVNRFYRVEVWNKDLRRWNDVELRHN